MDDNDAAEKPRAEKRQADETTRSLAKRGKNENREGKMWCPDGGHNVFQIVLTIQSVAELANQALAQLRQEGHSPEAAYRTANVFMRHVETRHFGTLTAATASLQTVRLAFVNLPVDMEEQARLHELAVKLRKRGLQDDVRETTTSETTTSE